MISDTSTAPAESPAQKVWWMLLLRGILAAFIGLDATFAPPPTAAALGLLAAIYFVIDGVVAVVKSIVVRVGRAWWVVTLASLLGVLPSVLIFMSTSIGVPMLSKLIGVWAIISGATAGAMGYGARHRRVLASMYSAVGVLSIALGAVIVFSPHVDLSTLDFALAVFGVAGSIGFFAAAFEAHAP